METDTAGLKNSYNFSSTHFSFCDKNTIYLFILVVVGLLHCWLRNSHSYCRSHRFSYLIWVIVFINKYKIKMIFIITKKKWFWQLNNNGCCVNSKTYAWQKNTSRTYICEVGTHIFMNWKFFSKFTSSPQQIVSALLLTFTMLKQLSTTCV